MEVTLDTVRGGGERDEGKKTANNYNNSSDSYRVITEKKNHQLAFKWLRFINRRNKKN